MLLEHNTDDIEIILIDDCSTDNSIEVIHQILDELNNFKQDNITIIQHKENKGVAYTKQEALDSSKGEFFIFIDGDDFIPEDYIETLIEYAKSNKALIYNFRTRLYPCGTTMDLDFTLWNKLFNRRAIDKYNIHFDTSLQNMDDVELWRRVSDTYPSIMEDVMPVNKIIYYYNLLAENTLTHEESLWYQTMDNLKEECR